MSHHRSKATRGFVLFMACGLAAGAGLRVARFMRQRRSPDHFRGEVHKPYAGYMPDEESQPIRARA